MLPVSFLRSDAVWKQIEVGSSAWLLGIQAVDFTYDYECAGFYSVDNGSLSLTQRTDQGTRHQAATWDTHSAARRMLPTILLSVPACELRHGNLFTKVEWSSVTFPYACPTTEIQFKLLRNPAFVHGSGTKCHLLISQHHDRSEQPPTCHFIIILCMYIYVTNTIIDTLISCSFKFTHYSFNTNQRRKQGWLLTKAPHILNASMWRRQLAARVTNNSSSSHPNDLLAPCRQ